MLNYEQLLSYSGLLIVEKDQDGNILKPCEKEELDKYQELILNINKIDDSYYDRKNNKWYDIDVVGIFDEDDNTMHTITYIKDITRYKNRELNAQRDQVTNLYNRALTDKLVSNYMLDAQNRRENFSIVLCDLDGFKSANDTYGHLCGDKVLREISNVLIENTSNYVDERDIVGRFGGDEFFLLFKNIDKNVAMEKANFIKQKVEDLVIVYDGKIIPTPTMSIGVYYVSIDELEFIDNIESFKNVVYDRADKALYHSKKSGKNTVTDYGNLDCKIYSKNRI